MHSSFTAGLWHIYGQMDLKVGQGITPTFAYTRQQPKKLSLNRRNDFEATRVCVLLRVRVCVRVCAENRFSVANDCLPVSLIKDLYI